MRSIHRHSLVALCVLASLGCDPPPPVEPVPTTMNDGIDWGVPSEPSEEPPPWTG